MYIKKVMFFTFLFSLFPVTAQKDATQKERITYELVSDCFFLKKELDIVLKQAYNNNDYDSIRELNEKFNNVRNQYEHVLHVLTGKIVSLNSVNRIIAIDIHANVQEILRK